MSLIYTPDLMDLLKNSNLIIDTCTIIDASKCEEVNDFLDKVRQTGCTLFSIQPVEDEFTCVARNQKEYEELCNFVKSLDITFIPDGSQRMLRNEKPNFGIALTKCKNIHPSYVDRALLAMPYYYRNSAEKNVFNHVKS